MKLIQHQKLETENYFIQKQARVWKKMRILNHIGISPLPEGFNSVKAVRSLVMLVIIAEYWILYHFVSIGCTFGSILFPSIFLLIKRRAASGFWRVCLYFLEQNNIEVVLTGDEISFGESAIVISNHRSLNDFFIIAYLARMIAENENLDGQFMLPRLNFFTWATIWRVPTLRLLFNIISYDENWEIDSTDMKYKLLKLNNYYDSKKKAKNDPEQSEFEVNNYPEWLVMFPEVNVFSKAESFLQKKQSEKYLLPVLNNVLYPRFSIFANAVKNISNSGVNISKLYSFTILYYQNEKNKDILQKFDSPSLLQFFADYPSKTVVRVHVKSKTLSRIPTRSKKIDKWLESEWVNKDKLVQSMEKNINNFL